MAAPLLLNRLAWLSLVGGLGAAASAQPEDPLRIDPVQPAASALYPDSAEAARGSGLSVAEATRRLRLQEVSAPHVSRLRREFADRIAGLYRESEGDYRLVVRLKGPAPVADRWIGTGRDRMRIQFLVGAAATLAETLQEVAESMPAIGARLPGLMGTGVDERTGEVMLNVYATGDDAERARAAEADLERLLGHPVRLRLLDSPVTVGDSGPARRAPPRPPNTGTPDGRGTCSGSPGRRDTPAPRTRGSGPFTTNRGRPSSASGLIPLSPASCSRTTTSPMPSFCSPAMPPPASPATPAIRATGPSRPGLPRGSCERFRIRSLPSACVGESPLTDRLWMVGEF